jgi:hypothetical protein
MQVAMPLGYARLTQQPPGSQARGAGRLRQSLEGRYNKDTFAKDIAFLFDGK